MQKRFFNYKDDDYTDWLNRQDLGITPYGLYTGFDAALDNTLTLKLNHNKTGVTEVTDAGARTAKLGILKTQQGVVIREDGPITLAVTENNSGFPRIDTVVVEHLYVKTKGGSDAIYKVIEGTANVKPVPQVLPFPEKQMAIGFILRPANSQTLATATYTRALVPAPGGDGGFVRTEGEQTVNGTKTMVSMLGKFGTAKIVGADIVLQSVGNWFVLPESDVNRYVDVTGIEAVFTADTYAFNILTKQKVKFLQNGDVYYFEAGELIQVVNISTASGVENNFYVINTGRIKYLKTKLTAELVGNKGVAIHGGGEMQLDGKGNFYDFSIAAGQELARLPIRAPFKTGETVAGSVIFARIKKSGASGTPVTLVNNRTTGSASTKGIVTPTGTDLSLLDGDILILIEDTTVWRLVGILGGDKNIITLQKAFNDFVLAVGEDISDINGTIGDMKEEYNQRLEDLGDRIDNIQITILTEAVRRAIAIAPEANLVLKGCGTTAYTGTFSSGGTCQITAGIAAITNDIRNAPAYNGTYPVYLELDPNNVNICRWVNAPLDMSKSILFNPYTSQRLEYAIKRASMDVGDIKLSTVISSEFDSVGRGRWGQFGFHLANGFGGTQNMAGLVPIGFADQPTTDPGNPETEYRSMNNVIGEKKHALTSSENGPHAHGFNSGDQGGRSDNANDRDVMVPGGTARNTDSSGLGTPHENRQPSRVLAFIQRIAT